MENQALVVVDGNEVSLEVLEQDVADSVVRAYGAERSYAKALNQVFKFDWFTFEASDTSDEAKQVKTRKTSLYARLKKAEHTNPSTVWARIRKYGAEDRYPPEVTEGAEGAEGEAEGNGNNQRDPLTRNIEELMNLYKFNKRQDSLPAKIAEAQKAIAQALICLGVDLSMVK